MFRNHFLIIGPVLLSLLNITGCGGGNQPPLGYVEGVVTIDDEPASLVMVEFQPIEQGKSPSYGFADSKGRYKLQFTGTRHGAVIGTHTIRLTFDDDPSPDDPAPKIQIPAKYNQRSELKAEVKKGSNRHDFDLKLSNSSTRTASK